MKKTLLILFMILPAVLSAQLNNDYPLAGPVRISDYSPHLILQRNTNDGGFTQGIQTRFLDGTNNWFFGNLHQDNWIVSKGDYQNVKFSIQSNGNVGIGTTNTSFKLEVNGSFQSGQGSFVNNAHSTGANEYNLELYSNNTGDPLKYVSLRFHQADQFWGQIRYNGYGFRLTQGASDDLNNLTLANLFAMNSIGIGTTNPDSKLTIFDGGGGNYLLNVGGTGNGKIKVRHIDGKHWSSTEVDNLYLQHGVNKNTIINAGGSTGGVGIGIMDPGSYKLNVSGKIRADEIVVNTTGADFVFDPEYNLPDLAEVESFINKNKHLPDIEPASKMQQEGMSMSEMQTKMLQKIEELTLYIIELNKKIEILEAEKNN